MLGCRSGVFTETCLRQLPGQGERGHQPLANVDTRLRIEFLYPLPELQVHLSTVALGIGTVVILDQKLAAFEDEEEAVLSHALANTASFVDHVGVGHQFVA